MNKPPSALRSFSLAASPPWMLLLISGGAGLILGMIAMMVIISPDKPVIPTPEPTPVVETTSTIPVVTSTKSDLPDSIVSLLNASTTLDILWEKSREVQPATEFPGSDLTSQIPYPDARSYSEPLPTVTSTYKYYYRGKVATMPASAFAGDSVYAAVSSDVPKEAGMGGDYPIHAALFYLVKHASTETRGFVYFATAGMKNNYLPYDNQSLVSDHPLVPTAPLLTFQKYSFPDTITLANGKNLTRSATSEATITEATALCTTTNCPGRIPVATTTDGQKIYSIESTYDNGDGCLIVYAQDGEQQTYYSLIETTDIDPTRSYESRTVPLVTNKQINWTVPAPSATVGYFPFFIGGCGGIGCPTILSGKEVPSMDQLVQIGTTKAGDPLYFPKNPQQSSLIQDVYEGWYNYGETGEKPSIDAFLQQTPVPLFLWKDGFGRWSVYRRNDLLPMGECGKPVVYLYPTKTQSIHVSLPSFVKVTKSEPSYPTQGWDVAAQPNGQLTMKNGQTYGSLFWEGTGVNYPLPKTGFIVRDGEVSRFLTETLAKYGLNAQESKEFMDFWTPKMVGSPYYRVSFLTDEWAAAAPLNVTPAPTTRIRLFMDWQKLQAPISIPEPLITTPQRNGFTLVEWGGLIRN